MHCAGRFRTRCFNLLFQPIVSLADRSLHHYEALLRPRPVPGCAFATPQDFVMLVEALGLASELDLTVANLVSDAAAASGLDRSPSISPHNPCRAAHSEIACSPCSRRAPHAVPGG